MKSAELKCQLAVYYLYERYQQFRKHVGMIASLEIHVLMFIIQLFYTLNIETGPACFIQSTYTILYLLKTTCTCQTSKHIRGGLGACWRSTRNTLAPCMVSARQKHTLDQQQQQQQSSMSFHIRHVWLGVMGVFLYTGEKVHASTLTSTESVQQKCRVRSGTKRQATNVFNYAKYGWERCYR